MQSAVKCKHDEIDNDLVIKKKAKSSLPSNLLPMLTDKSWQIIDKSKYKNILKSNIVTVCIPAKGTQELKHKYNEIGNDLVFKRKPNVACLQI